MAGTQPRKPVVIILDMAVGYGWAPGSFGYEMVAQVRKLKDAAYASGVQVIHVHSMRRPTDGLADGRPPTAADLRLGPGSEGLNVIPELRPVDRDIIIYKRYLSGFSENDLDYTLRTMGCDMVIIAGASTDNTVLWTAADAFQKHYRVVVVEDCTIVHRPNERAGAKEAALHIVEAVVHGEVMPLDQVIATYLSS